MSGAGGPTSPLLPGHPWVAQIGIVASGAVLLPTSEGIAALCRQGRGAFVRVLDELLATHGLSAPARWRLVDAWPDNITASWIDAVLAQSRPTDADVLGEQREGDSAVLSLRVPVDLLLFDVHFPELPVLPGLVQLAWALALGAMRFRTPTGCRRVEMLKFQRPLRPGAQVQLSLRHDPALRRLHFGYTHGEVEYSSGRLQWEREDD